LVVPRSIPTAVAIVYSLRLALVRRCSAESATSARRSAGQGRTPRTPDRGPRWLPGLPRIAGRTSNRSTARSASAVVIKVVALTWRVGSLGRTAESPLTDDQPSVLLCLPATHQSPGLFLGANAFPGSAGKAPCTTRAVIRSLTKSLAIRGDGRVRPVGRKSRLRFVLRTQLWG
jgi:hypothetical protein